ncbi:MED6-domain-containing protein [Thelephora ganbajun]|uniref:MED6-domain-containing protein n=1 Tax=Thelephora ganbajun TaxID=370292 RepID=A0ACB6ZHA5_THEGA|nr:MED6-domain-containing protein [Thelephora ganbajun]
MDNIDLHPPDDYSHRFFIWHEWIQANGPLTTQNVFDYFSHSMFYDKQSNNQVLRMQTMHTGQPLTNEAEELKRFTGVEFAVTHSEPPTFFIIQKRERLSPDEVRPMAAYFIMNNRIYQSPDLYTVLSNRLLTSLSSLQTSLDILRTHKPPFMPRTGFVWPIMEPEATGTGPEQQTEKRKGTDEGTNTTSASNSRKQQNHLLLFNAMRTTAAHASTTFTNSTRPTVDQPPVAETVLSETTAEGAGSVSVAATPAPPPRRSSTPRVIGTAQSPELGKGQPGAPGIPPKKKKKRTNTASNTPAPT